MQKIILIYTGGTIGMQENPQTGALESIDFGNLIPLIPELGRFECDIQYVDFGAPVDSCDIDAGAWKRMVAIIADNYERADGFVILHGTDTMAYTASALSFMLEGLSKPVVLTGSQLPLGKMRTDGNENLVTAVEIASALRSDGTPCVPEVCIFFHDKLLRGNRTTKSDADGFDAFQSFNYPPLARAAVNIQYDFQHILGGSGTRVATDSNSGSPARTNAGADAIACNGRELVPHYVMDDNMLVISLFPGIKEAFVREMLEIPGLKGVVLRTFGSGNAPSQPWLAELLRQAVAKGIVIVNITQCTGGNVAMERYRTGLLLRSTGLISGLDGTVEAALTKMMRLFGDGLSPEDVRAQMLVSLAGEI